MDCFAKLRARAANYFLMAVPARLWNSKQMAKEAADLIGTLLVYNWTEQKLECGHGKLIVATSKNWDSNFS